MVRWAQEKLSEDTLCILIAENVFVLNTPRLSDEALEAAGLGFDDIQNNRFNGYYDHLVDFRVIPRP